MSPALDRKIPRRPRKLQKTNCQSAINSCSKCGVSWHTSQRKLRWSFCRERVGAAISAGRFRARICGRVMPVNRLHERALIHPAATRSDASRVTGLFPVRSSFLLVQIEYARIAGALATIVLARPERSNRRWIVVGGKLGHRGATRFSRIESGKEPPRIRYLGENAEYICCSTAMFRRRIDWALRSLLKTRIRSRPIASL